MKRRKRPPARSSRLRGHAPAAEPRRARSERELRAANAELIARNGELRRGNFVFCALVESAPDAMVVVDAQASIRLVNAQAQRLFGYEREELVGRPIETLVPAAVREVHREHRSGYLREPRARPIGIGLQLSAVRKDGRQIPVEISLSPIDTPEGLLVCAIVRDVADRRRLEQDARRFAVLAERRLARDVHDNLAQGLAGIVVHLEGAADVLTADQAEAGKHIEKALAVARSSLEQARRSLLALRPEILEETDLPGSLERLAAGLSVESEVEVRFACLGPRRRLAAEIEENLLRIAQEALGNALRHGGTGSVGVELRYERSSVRMRIEDAGRGFDARAVGRGSGLGLSIMKGRAASLGGELSVRAQPGKGTRVEVVVPLPDSGIEGRSP